MEQVFFRLHLRCVTTVTRLLPAQTRRVLEYVTLANAFFLLISLTWLHVHFVNTKGQSSAESCLRVALERVGVDPAHLHVIQIHIRKPPDDRGGRGLESLFAAEEFEKQVQGVEGGGKPGAGVGPAMQPDPGGGAQGAESTCSVYSGSISSTCSSSALPSESLPPQVFYSMKLASGKDAVGTLSGPGTLAIGPRVSRTTEAADACKSADGTDDNVKSDASGTYDEGAQQDRHAQAPAVWTLVDKPSLGKGWVEVDSRVPREVGDLESPVGTKQCSESRRLAGDDASEEELDSCRRVWAQETVEGTSDQVVDEEAAEGTEATVATEEINSIPDEVYLYSLEKGFLMLRPDLRQKHGIITANVTINAHDPCLGGQVIQALVKDFVGYDTVVMNWLISLYGGKGFLYGVRNNELFNLNYAAEFVDSTEDMGKYLVFKVGVMFTTLFLFFTTTTLVSFTLRETQERMLKFTFLLQHHVRHRLPYAPLIFTHVVESLVFVPIMVGILFFLFEFFSDQLLAFMVLSVVWLCEVYSVVSVRTAMCIRFFPQMFFLYFTLFHVYFFSFPFGFSYLALVTTVLFLQHAMLFFWNRYEVPALRAGAVSASRPRQAGMIIGVVPRYDPQGMLLPLPTAEQRDRRTRAATLTSESLESIPGVDVMRRVIFRSNSSPSPSSPRPPHDVRVPVASRATVVPPSARRPPGLLPAIDDTSGSGGSPFPGRRPGAMGPLGRGLEGRGDETLGDEGRRESGAPSSLSGGENVVGGPTGEISPPLLGSFPFSIWSRARIPPAAQNMVAMQAAVQRTRWQGGDQAATSGRNFGDEDTSTRMWRDGIGGEVPHGGGARELEVEDATSLDASSRAAEAEGPAEHSEKSPNSVSSMTASTMSPPSGTTAADAQGGVLESGRRSLRPRDCSVTASGLENSEASSETSVRYPTSKELVSESEEHADEGGQNAGYGATSALRRAAYAAAGAGGAVGWSDTRQPHLEDRDSFLRDNQRVGTEAYSNMMDDDEQSNAAQRLSSRTTLMPR